jgi:hypothetical protein
MLRRRSIVWWTRVLLVVARGRSPVPEPVRLYALVNPMRHRRRLATLQFVVRVRFDTEQPIANVCVLLENAKLEYAPMPHFFLHLRDGDRLLPDDGEGQEFATLDAVRDEAIESARQILSAAVLNGTAATLNQHIEVVDKHGKTILTVPVGRAVGTETQR